MRLPGLFKGLSFPRAAIRSPALILPGATKKQGAGSGGGPAAATQTEQEAASSTAVFTSPGRQHFHPGHPKCWAYITVSAGTPTLQTSYNIVSVADTGSGQVTITIATDFSSANWAPHVSVGGAADTWSGNYTSIAAGSVIAQAYTGSAGDTFAINDPASYAFSGLGDHA